MKPCAASKSSTSSVSWPASPTKRKPPSASIWGSVPFTGRSRSWGFRRSKIAFFCLYSESTGTEDVFQARRRAEQLEVALIEDDAADQACVRVDADAELQAAGVRFLDLARDVGFFPI